MAAASPGRNACRALNCPRTCPPDHLMCRRCWALVPVVVQQRIYATAKRRHPTVDESWVRWMRAANEAIAHVGKHQYPQWDADSWLAEQQVIVKRLEQQGVLVETRVRRAAVL